MNWDAVGAVGQIIGAAGVIISVAYLSVQIRKQTAENRLGATRELAAQHQESMRIIAADPSMSKIYLKAIKDYRSLPDDERVRISIVFNDIFRNTEQRYLHSKGDHVESKYLDSINKVALLLLKYPGIRDWWLTSTRGFHSEFVSYITKMMADADTLEVPRKLEGANETDT